jgi:transcription initiation factor IIE alpha subunit
MKLPQNAITLASVTDVISSARTITTAAPLIPHDYQETEASGFQCPDCSTLLSVYYDKQEHQRFYCENCEQEITTEEIISEWDSPKGKSNDDYESDNILIVDDNDENSRNEICDLLWA